MNTLIPLYIALVVIFVGFLLVASRALSRRLRVGSAISGLSLVVVAFFATTELLSLPKPTRLEILRQGVMDIEIIAARIIKNQGIYLLTQLPDETEPRYYVLPWDQDLADQIRKGMENNKRGLRMTRPFSWDRSWDLRDPPKVYEPPPEKLPPKMGDPEPETFKNPMKAI